jgi:hypothetical protein
MDFPKISIVKPTAVQFFTLVAIVVGGLVSYFPPPSNAVAIWAIVSMFLGYAIRDLFGSKSPSLPPVELPASAP